MRTCDREGCYAWSQWRVMYPDSTTKFLCQEHKKMVEAVLPDAKFQFLGAVPASIEAK